MPFPTQSSRVPTGIGNITILLKDLVSPVTEQQVHAEIQVLDAEGKNLKLWRGRLEDIVAPGVVTSLTTQMNAIRTQAGNEFIP